MSSMPWVKLYTEMLDDPKIGRLPDAIKWRFVSLILLAGECDQDGALQASDKPMSIDDIAWRLRMPSEQCEAEIESLLMCGVLELDADVYYLPKFSDRQGRPQSEKRAQWRERQARYRESKETQDKTQESVTRDSPVTNASRVEKRRVEKSRVEKSAGKPRTTTPLPIQAQTFIDAGGKFPSGTLSDGTSKKDNAIRVICDTVKDDEQSLLLWRQVVSAYCAQWSAKSYTVMLNDYYLSGRIPGQSKNGNGHTEPRKPSVIYQ